MSKMSREEMVKEINEGLMKTINEGIEEIRKKNIEISESLDEVDSLLDELLLD